MASATFFIFMHLVAGAAASHDASSDTAVLSPPLSKVPETMGGLFTNMALDGAVYEALSEASLALLVFGLASAMMAKFRPKRAPKTTAKAVSTPASKPWRRSQGQNRPQGQNKPTPSPNPPALAATKDTHKVSETDALASAVKAGKARNLPQLLDAALQRSLAAVAHLGASEQDVASHLLLAALRASAASHCFTDAIVAYDHFAGHIGAGSAKLWSVLLYSAAEAGSFNRCQTFFEKLCQQTPPSEHDFVNMARCYAGLQDAAGLKASLAKLSSCGHCVSAYTWNRALAACGGSDSALDLAEVLKNSGVCQEGLDAVGYNTLMKYYARAGGMSHCFQLRKEMLANGVQMSEVTFGTLLDACVRAKELDRAREVFGDLCASGLQLNVVHCTTFIKVLTGAGRLDEAAGVLEEMVRSPGVKPDLITYSTLVKAYSENGDVSSALKILESMIKQGVRADGIIFNSVLGSCYVFPLKAADVMRTFEALISYGMTPDSTTLSILLKGLAHSEAWSTSLQTLKDAPKKFGCEPEERLFAQLAQACVKAREPRAATEAFSSMLEAAQRRRKPVDAVAVSRIIRNCVVGGQVGVAAEMQDMAQKARVPIEASVERMVKATLARKASGSAPW